VKRFSLESNMSNDVCVIFNPAAGKKRAGRRLERLYKNLSSRIDFLPTERPAHARELARQAALDGYRVVSAAGGDGTVHEVANGLLLAKRPDVQFAILPIGSSNDFAHSFDFHQAHQLAPSPVSTIDVGVVREPGGRELYFVCCLGLGFNGAVTLESRKIHRLQGIFLYGLATLRALWYHYRVPTMELSIDDEPIRSEPTLMFSALVGRREGGFVLAPKAKLDDGLLDFVHSGNLSRLEILQFLPRLALFGPPENHPKIHLGQCKKVSLKSPLPLTVHVDGEFFARPEDGIQQIEIQIVPRALQVRTFASLF
jgi:diacylglycerol kinase family enzyme